MPRNVIQKTVSGKGDTSLYFIGISASPYLAARSLSEFFALDRATSGIVTTQFSEACGDYNCTSSRIPGLRAHIVGLERYTFMWCDASTCGAVTNIAESDLTISELLWLSYQVIALYKV
jgi:hypothetical protein